MVVTSRVKSFSTTSVAGARRRYSWSFLLPPVIQAKFLILLNATYSLTCFSWTSSPGARMYVLSCSYQSRISGVALLMTSMKDLSAPPLPDDFGLGPELGEPSALAVTGAACTNSNISKSDGKRLYRIRLMLRLI